MKNARRIAEMTHNIIQKDLSTWITLYYSIEKDAVYCTPGEGRYKVCRLLNVNTEKDIEEAVDFWKKL